MMLSTGVGRLGLNLGLLSKLSLSCDLVTRGGSTDALLHLKQSSVLLFPDHGQGTGDSGE